MIARDAWRYLLDIGHFVRTGDDQAGKDSFFGYERCRLCCEGKGEQRQGVWAGFSIGEDRRELFDSLSLYFTEDERQGVLAPSYHRALCNIRRDSAGFSDDGQGLLLSGKHKICGGDGRECGWSSTTDEYKKSDRAPPQNKELFNRRAEVEPLNRTRKKIWIRKKQNEIRRGHVGVGDTAPSLDSIFIS